MLGLLGWSRSLPLSVVILLVLGIASITFTATANSRLQLGAPPALRGRVMSFYIFLNAGTTPIGSLLVGGLAQGLGVRLAVGLMAGLCALGIGVALLYRARHPGQAGHSGLVAAD